MATKIRRVSDLPDWFDLAKYDGLSTLTTMEWADTIDVRLLTSGLRARGSVGKTYDRLVAELRENPLWKLPARGSEPHPYAPLAVDPLGFGPVRSLSLPDAQFVAERLKYRIESENLQRSVDPYVGGAPVLDCTAAFDSPAEEIHWDDPIDLSPSAIVHVVVDLYASDELIEQGFRDWLAWARRNFGVPGRQNAFTTSDFAIWIDRRVLPYFDLVEWSEESGVQLPLHVLGEALAPSKPDGNIGEWVRKTVRTHARNVMTEVTVEALRRQAAKEMDEILPEEKT